MPKQRWLRKVGTNPPQYYGYTDILAKRTDMMEVSEEEALGKAQEQAAPAEKASAGPAQEPDLPPDGSEPSEGEPEDLGAYIDNLDQDALDAYAEQHPMIGQRPKHNMSLANQKSWVKQMLGLEVVE